MTFQRFATVMMSEHPAEVFTQKSGYKPLVALSKKFYQICIRTNQTNNHIKGIQTNGPQ
jgi:hypothetical protein